MTSDKEMNDIHGLDNSESDGNTSFLRAARNGQLEKVLEYLKTNIDINTSNANGLNALHLASKDGHVEIVEELLKRGAIVDAATKKGNTALHIASLAGQEEVVKLLVQHGASVNVQSQNGFTPLYMAAQENHDNVVKFLLANGANQSLSTEDGFTPLAVAMQQGHDKVVTVLLENDTRGKVRLPALHIAAKKDDVRAAKLLLENDHNPDVTSKSGFTPLHIASHYGNQPIANLLVQKGADVNYSAKHNITPLHVAAKWGKSNMVSLLLEQGAHIEAKTRDGLTPLHCAARSGHEQVVDMLLEKSAPISSKTKNGLAPLHMAAQGDHVDAARILLYHRAPVDEVTVDYLTALHVAAHCGHVRVAKLLLDRQADANARALNGFTPLHIACKKNRIKVVELLLKHGACIGATTESGLTPLHVASFMGCMNIVIYLLQHDASPDIPTVRGETPLHLAARANQTDIIRILLRNGAQVDARAREQQTPLHVASRLGNVDIVMLLLQHGAKIDNTTKDLYTSLHIAAKEGQDEVAAVLIENGASLNSTTKKGFTPLHLAAKYGHLKVAKLLVQKEAPVDAQGKNGVTPLHVASHYDHQNVALLLLEKGASPHAEAKNGHTPLHIAARKNQMDVAHTLLEYGAKPDVESKAGFTPLHLSSQEGHAEISSLLLEHRATPDYPSKNGLTPLHLCAQENRVAVADLLHKNGADIDKQTKAGYTPLHIASHYGQADMVKFLLSKGANVKATTSLGYTPLHQAAQQGHTNIVNILLENSAQPNAVTNNGQTPLNIAQKLGYITVIDTLKEVTETAQSPVPSDEKYRHVAPELMHETFLSDSEEEGEDTLLGDQTYRYLTADEMKSLGDDSLPIDVTRDERIDSNRMVGSDDPNAYPPRHIEDSISPEHIHPNYVEYIKKATDNVDISRHPVNIGFLVSFLVDARGGAMRGCRHSGVRVIVPPRCAPSPTRITCRYVRPQRTPHPPPLMEGEALASRVLELGPVGAKFLGPVIIEVPHFAALRGKEREIVILRSDNGESWKEHTVEATEDVLNEVLRESFDTEDLNQLEDHCSGRTTRIITQDFPQYFAVISRIRQEVHAIGPEGGMVSSTVVPQVQAVFPQGALTKKIKVGLQAQPIDPELTAKLLGHGVAVSPVVTVEPRRRKFHKAITLSMPAPRAHSQGMINQYSGSAPTLRLLCSITGGTSRAQWEDVTGSTPLTFVNDCVSFTTTVSARFWLMDCRNVGDATKMATELYREAIHVPFIAKFVVFAKRIDPLEARLRVFCMTDDKEEKTLEYQEQFTEIAKSRDVEVLEGKSQFIEFAGNLVPITKSGEQLQFSFRAFKENRLPFSVRVKDQHAEAVSRCLFMREPKVQKGEAPQQPICILNIVLPDDIVSETITLTDSESIRKKYYANENFDYYRQDPRLADMSNLLGDDWVDVATHLGLTSSEINVIKSEYPDSVAKQAQSMLRMWLSQSGSKVQTNTLENALRRIGREDIVNQCLNIDNRNQEILRIRTEEKEKHRLISDNRIEDKSSHEKYTKEERVIKSFTSNLDKYSAEEKTFEPSDEEEEDFNKTVPERREQIVKRLSTERTIPASSQRVEIVQEISSIKRQSLVEDKIAEVQQKANIEPMKINMNKPVSKIIQEKKEQMVTAYDEEKSEKTEKSQINAQNEEKRDDQHLSNLDDQEKPDRRDSVLLEEVTQLLETKRPVAKLSNQEDPNSPEFSKTPPPSPADFLKEKQATTIQEWNATEDTEKLSRPQPDSVREETTVSPMQQSVVIPSVSYESILLSPKSSKSELRITSSPHNNSYTHIDAMLDKMLTAVDQFDQAQNSHANFLSLEPSSDALIEIPIRKSRSKKMYTATANIFVDEEDSYNNSATNEDIIDSSRTDDNEFSSTEYLDYKDDIFFENHSIDHETAENLYEPIDTQSSSVSNDLDYVWWEGAYRNLSIVVEEDEDNYSLKENKTKFKPDKNEIPKINRSPICPSTSGENTDCGSESSQILSSSPDESDSELSDQMIKAEVKLLITSKEDGLDAIEVKSVKEFRQNDTKLEACKNEKQKKKIKLKNKLRNIFDRSKSESETVKLTKNKKNEKERITRQSFTLPRIFMRSTDFDESNSKVADAKRWKSNIFAKPNDNYPLAINLEGNSELPTKVDLFANRPFYPVYTETTDFRTTAPSKSITYVPPSEVTISEAYCNWSSECDHHIGKTSSTQFFIKLDDKSKNTQGSPVVTFPNFTNEDHSETRQKRTTTESTKVTESNVPKHVLAGIDFSEETIVIEKQDDEASKESQEHKANLVGESKLKTVETSDINNDSAAEMIQDKFVPKEEKFQNIFTKPLKSENQLDERYEAERKEENEKSEVKQPNQHEARELEENEAQMEKKKQNKTITNEDMKKENMTKEIQTAKTHKEGGNHQEMKVATNDFILMEIDRYDYVEVDDTKRNESGTREKQKAKQSPTNLKSPTSTFVTTETKEFHEAEKKIETKETVEKQEKTQLSELLTENKHTLIKTHAFLTTEQEHYQDADLKNVKQELESTETQPIEVKKEVDVDLGLGPENQKQTTISDSTSSKEKHGFFSFFKSKGADKSESKEIAVERNGKNDSITQEENKEQEMENAKEEKSKRMKNKELIEISNDFLKNEVKNYENIENAKSDTYSKQGKQNLNEVFLQANPKMISEELESQCAYETKNKPEPKQREMFDRSHSNGIHEQRNNEKLTEDIQEYSETHGDQLITKFSEKIPEKDMSSTSATKEDKVRYNESDDFETLKVANSTFISIEKEKYEDFRDDHSLNKQTQRTINTGPGIEKLYDAMNEKQVSQQAEIMNVSPDEIYRTTKDFLSSEIKQYDGPGYSKFNREIQPPETKTEHEYVEEEKDIEKTTLSRKIVPEITDLDDIHIEKKSKKTCEEPKESEEKKNKSSIFKFFKGKSGKDKKNKTKTKEIIPQSYENENVEPLKASSIVIIDIEERTGDSDHAIKSSTILPIQKEIKNTVGRDNVPVNGGNISQEHSTIRSNEIHEINKDFLGKEIEHYHDEKYSRLETELKPNGIKTDRDYKIENTAELKHISSFDTTHPNEIYLEKPSKDTAGYSKQLDNKSITTLPKETPKEDKPTNNDVVVNIERENQETLRAANSTFLSIEKEAYEDARDIENKIEDPLMKQTQNVIEITPEIENVKEKIMNALPDEINKMTKDFLFAEKELYDGEKYSHREPQTSEIHSQPKYAKGERETEKKIDPETADEIHGELTGESEDPKEKPKKSSIFKFFKGKPKKEIKNKAKSKDDMSQSYENVEPLKESATVPIEDNKRSEYGKHTVETGELLPFQKEMKETFSTQTNVSINEGDTSQEQVHTNMLPSIINEQTKDFLDKEKQLYHDENYSRSKSETKPNEIKVHKDEKYECSENVVEMRDDSRKQEKDEKRFKSTLNHKQSNDPVHRTEMSDEQPKPSIPLSMIQEMTNNFLSNEIQLYNDAKASNLGLRSELETVTSSEQAILKKESHKLTNGSDNIEEEKGMLRDRIESKTSKILQGNINEPKTLEEPRINITLNEVKESTASFLLEETKNYDRSVNYPEWRTIEETDSGKSYDQHFKENTVSLKSSQSVPQKTIEEKPLTEKHIIETANEKIQKELTVKEDEKIEETTKVTTKRKKSGIFNYLKGKFKKSRSVEADTSKEEYEELHEMINATSSFLTEEQTRYEDGKPSIIKTPLKAMESETQKSLLDQSVEHIPVEDEINIEIPSCKKETKTCADTSETESKETWNAESDVKEMDKEIMNSKQNGNVKKVSFDESLNINRELAMITQSFLEKEKNYDCDEEMTLAKLSNLKISDNKDNSSKTENTEKKDLLVLDKQSNKSGIEGEVILEPHKAGYIEDIEKKEMKSLTTNEDKIMKEDQEKMNEQSKSYKKKGILGFFKKKSKDTEDAASPLPTISDNETHKTSGMETTKVELIEPTTTLELDKNKQKVGIGLEIQEKSHPAEEITTKKKQKKTQLDNESTEPKGILGFLFKKMKPKNKEETSTYQAAEDFSKILEDTKTFLDKETEMYQDTRRPPSKNTNMEQKTQEEHLKLPEKEVIREEMTQVATSNLNNIESHDIEKKEEELIDEIPEYTAFDFIKEEIETFEKTRLPCTSKVDSSIRIETEIETVEGDSPKEIITKKIFVTERLVEGKDDMASNTTSQEILKKLMDANEDLKAQLNAQENENQTIFRIKKQNSQLDGEENRTEGKIVEDHMKQNSHDIIGGEFVENIEDVELARSNVVEDVSIFEEKIDIRKNRNQEVVTDLDDITSDEHSSINSQNTEEMVKVTRGKSQDYSSEYFPINEENISSRGEILTSQASPNQRIEKSRNKRGSITKFTDQGGTLGDVVNVTEDLVADLKIQYSPYPKKREGFKNVEMDDEVNTCEDDEITLSNRKRKPIFRIESEEETPSNPENNSANEEIDSLIRGLVSDDAGEPVENITKNLVEKEAVSDGHVDIETIEKKLYDLGKALETLEKLEDSEPSDKNEVRERKLRRIERKFEHMASETNESPPENKQSIELSNSPKTEQYQELVSQLSQDEVMSFQGDYNNLWDEYTFSKTDEWNSKTPDSQADVLELPQDTSCKELTDASQNIPTNIQPPQPKPRHQKSKDQPDEKDSEPDNHPPTVQDDLLDENEEIEDISYQDKKKFWENIAREPTKKPTKRNSIQETTAPPIPKPRGTLQYSYSVAETTFEKTTIVENTNEMNFAKTTSERTTNIENPDEIHTVSSMKEADLSGPTQISSDLSTEQTEDSEKPAESPKEIQKSDSVDTDTDGREDSSSQADNAGYISDSGDVEHYISDSEIEDRVPQIRERQMSVFVPPSVSQRTRYERSASLPTEDLYEVSARSTKLRKQYYEEQIKKEMIKEQLTIELEDEGSPERKCLSSPEMKPEETITIASVPTNERSDVIFESEFEEEDSREDHKNFTTSKDEASEIHVDKSETEKSEKLIHSNVPSPEQKADADVQENIPEITFTLSGKQRRISEESDEYAVEEVPKISPVPEEIESNIEESQEVPAEVSEKHDTESGDPFEESTTDFVSETRSTIGKLITSDDSEEIQDLVSHTLKELEASKIVAHKMQDEISEIQTAKEERKHDDTLEDVQLSGSINVEHTLEVKPTTEKLEQAACSSEGTDEIKLPETLQKSEEKLLAESILDAEIADIDLESEDLKQIVSRLESMHKFRKLRASTKLPIKIKKPEIATKTETTTEDVEVIDSKQESQKPTMSKPFAESRIPKQIGAHSVAKIQSTDKQLEKPSSQPVFDAVEEPETSVKHIEEEPELKDNQKSVIATQIANKYQTSEIESSIEDIKASEEIQISKDIQEPIPLSIEPSDKGSKLEDTKLEQEEYTMNQSETPILIPEKFEISKGSPDKGEEDELKSPLCELDYASDVKSKEIPSTQAEVHTSELAHDQAPSEHKSVDEELQKGNVYYRNIEMETKTSEFVDIKPKKNVEDENLIETEPISLTNVTEITQEELDKSSEIELTTEKHLNDQSEYPMKDITIPADEDVSEKEDQHSKKTSKVEFSEIMADREVSSCVLESESDKFSTKINQPQENIENTIWEVSVESEMLKEEKLTSLRTASHQESIGTRSDSLSDKVIDDNTTDETNLDQEPSDSLPSNKLEFDGHDDMKKIILDSLHQQKVDPEEAKLIANSLIEEIEMEIQKVENFNRGLTSKSESLDSEKHVTEYLKELAETKGLDQREVELVESVLERRQRQISRLSRGDTQASSMEITDEDLRYSETEYDYSNVLQQQMGQLEAEHSDHLKNFDSLVEDQEPRGDSPLSTKHEETRESIEEKGDKDKEEQGKCEKSFTQRRDIILEEDENFTESLSDELDVKKIKQEPEDSSKVHFSESIPDLNKTKAETLTVDEIKIVKSETQTEETSIVQKERIDSPKPQICDQKEQLIDEKEQLIDEKEQIEQQTEGNVDIEPPTEKTELLIGSEELNLPISEQLEGQCPEKYSLEESEQSVEKVSSKENIQRTSSSDSKSSIGSSKTPDDIYSTCSSSKKLDSDGSSEVVHRKYRKHEESASRKADRKSALELETYSSSGESHYHSFEIDSKSRPCSSDVEGLLPTGSSEYESALNSQDLSIRSQVTSGEYHTAISSLSSKESMMSIESESSGNLASIEVSETSETLVPTNSDLEGDIDMADQQIFEDGEDWQASEFDNHEPSEDPLVKSSTPPTPKDAVDIPHKMKRSHEMTFQPEPRALATDSPQTESNDIDEKFATSLDEGSVLSVSLSSTSSAQLRTVIEFSRTESGGPEESLTSALSDHISFDDSDILAKTPENVVLIDSSTSTNAIPKEPIESVTILSASINDNGITSACSQVITETISQSFDVQKLKNEELKKKGHRRQESTSFIPTLIQGVVKPTEIVFESSSILMDSETDASNEKLSLDKTVDLSIRRESSERRDSHGKSSSTSSEKSSFEEAEAEAAFSMVAHISPVHKIKQICPIIEDIDAEKIESEAKEIARRERIERANQIRDASPGSIPDIKVTEHMAPLDETEFRYPELEIEREELEQENRKTEEIESSISKEPDTEEQRKDEADVLEETDSLEDACVATEAEPLEKPIEDSKLDKGKVPSEKASNEEERASDSPNSDSFELVERPDIIDDFVVIEEIGKEASEMDSEGKSVAIQAKPKRRKRDEEIDAYLAKSDPTPLTKMTELKYFPDTELDFEFEDSPPQAQVDSNAKDYGSRYDQELEANRKWIEQQFHGDHAAMVAAGYGYEMEFERGPLEDIKEEDINDIEGSSRIGSLGSQKEGSSGSMKDSYSSTPEYDVLAGRRYFTRSGEHDDISMSSLQEFENLERAMSLETKKMYHGSGSQESSNGSFKTRYYSSKGQGDDNISASSLKEFEGLEKACIAAHKTEIKVKEEEELLSQMEEKQEIVPEKTEIDTTDKSKVTESDEEDYEKRMFEIDEIIRQAQNNVERFTDLKEPEKTESLGRGDSIEEVSKVPDLDLDAPLKATTETTWKEDDPMVASTDSLDLEPSKPIQYGSTDSLDQKQAAVDVMTASTDSIEFNNQISRNITTDSIENKTEGSNMVCSDSLEIAAAVITRPQLDSLDEDEQKIFADHSSSDTGKDFSSSVRDDADEHIHELMLGSTDSLEPTSSTATHATYQYETDSVFSGSFTSGGSNTMVSSTDTIEQNISRDGVDIGIAARKVWFDEVSSASGRNITTEFFEETSMPYVTEVIEPSDDPTFSHTIHRRVQMPVEVRKVTFHGADADEQLEQFIKNFGENEEQVHETEEIDSAGNVHTRRVVQKRFVVKSGDEASNLGKAIHTEGENLEITQRFDVRPTQLTTLTKTITGETSHTSTSEPSDTTTTKDHQASTSEREEEEVRQHQMDQHQLSSEMRDLLREMEEASKK